MDPFSSEKVVYHLHKWECIYEDDYIPHPFFVTIDPIHSCNLKCKWCNAKNQLSKSTAKLDATVIRGLPNILKKRWGVRAVCIAGGGEPLLHPNIDQLINGLVDVGVEVGLVTNGSLINKHLKALSRCRWVGVSVDAATEEVYGKLKGGKIETVFNNMVRLREDCKELTYKYLIHPDNIKDIPRASYIASEIGCDYLHIRPVGLDWKQVQRGYKVPIFSPYDIGVVKAHIEHAKDIMGKSRVKATLGKFGGDWGISHSFNKCYATGMTCVIRPDGLIDLCCDRRGDDKLHLGEFTLWGTDSHKRIMSNINLKDCPRCTYSPHNEAFEHFVIKDTVCKDFI